MSLEPGSEREIAYTDKGDAFWVTRTGGYNSSPWHGFTASKHAYLEDLFIYANGKLLPREEALVKVSPFNLIRVYPALGIREIWTLLDKQRTLTLTLKSDSPTDWIIQPAILGGNQVHDFAFVRADSGLNIFVKNLQRLDSAYPNIELWFSEPINWQPAESPDVPLFTAFLTESALISGSNEVTVSVSLNKGKINSTRSLTNIIQSKAKRKERLENRLIQSRLTSNNPAIDDAVAWAHASLDALVMDQMGTGIYAGLPWFDDYWGRDTFISFAGAALVSGRFSSARQILESFALLQNIDRKDLDYGRVPNRAQPQDIIYNTTDGTPWFVRSIWDYYRYTGDEAFLKEMWPAIQHATRGSLLNWTDENGLLRHADADTWMDAKGPDGAWSPRGDRALDIQFIWRDQLEITRRFALKFQDRNLEEQVTETLSRFELGLDQFISANENYLVDHLNEDGSQDKQIRPNIFLVPPLFRETCDWSSFKYLAPQLITPDGVLSLSQNDANFHPYHHLPGMYVQDAAYHNGIIWTWNSAATITQAIHFHQYHYADSLFQDLTEQILQRGALGTIAELTDAWPIAGELHLSGTFSQAWSLAEYLRSIYQDILGVQPDLDQGKVRIAPRLLSGIEQVIFAVFLGSDEWAFSYNETASSFEIDIERSNSDPIRLELSLLEGETVSNLEFMWEDQDIHLRYEKQMGQWTVPAHVEDYSVKPISVSIPINSLPFCMIDTSLIVPVLEGPEHRLLNEEEVMNPSEPGKIIYQIQDVAGDDKGDSGLFTYPANPQFAPGIVDIREFTISENSKQFHFEIQFENLVDPGWHPEYGYQLTYCTIGISYDSESGNYELGKNSGAKFKAGFMADQIMYVSGGILLVDDRHKTLAEYMPRRVSGAIGDDETDKIEFLLPKNIFDGDLSEASFQVAVGCQDDHGGAGIGDFRDVKSIRAQWNGGGKVSDEESNIYDWLFLE